MSHATFCPRRTKIVAGAALLSLAGLVAVAAGDPKPARRAVDRSKGAVESPLKAVVAKAAAGAFVNPRVAPGRVKWHPTLDAACEAARKSGKPVLLFQMMGKLDEQFC